MDEWIYGWVSTLRYSDEEGNGSEFKQILLLMIQLRLQVVQQIILPSQLLVTLKVIKY